MANIAVQNPLDNQWQSIGAAALGNEYPFASSHLNSGRNTQHQLRSPASFSLVRNSSLALRRSGSLHPVAKVHRFLHRLSWNRRSKTYVFGKSYLQRQASFVVTPDRSSRNFSFKDRDLFKRKPRPRVWRTSQPIAAWKNSRPLDVLLNHGVVDAPQTMPLQEANDSDYRHQQEQPQPQQGEPEQEPHRQHQRDVSVNSVGDGLNLGEDQPAGEQGAQNWVKISLPVKHNRNSSGSAEHSESSPSSKSNGTPRSSHRLSYLDSIPQTPVPKSQREFGGDGNSDESGSIGRSIVNELRSSTNSRKPRPVSAPPSRVNRVDSRPSPDVRSHRASVIGGGAQGLARATTLDSTYTPQSPTALPSNYRPESWRRSAIIARSSFYADSLAGDMSPDSGFVDVWSNYLRMAIAQRAVRAKERTMWELKNELRWSRNLEWESEYDDGSTESTCSETASSNPSESSSGTSGTSAYSGSSPESGGSSHFSSDQPSLQELKDHSAETNRSSGDDDSSRYSHSQSSSKSYGGSETEYITAAVANDEKVDDEVMRTPSSVGYERLNGGDFTPRAITSRSKDTPLVQASPLRHKTSGSKLAPVNSPRELASASMEALAATSPKRGSHSVNRNSFGEALKDSSQKYYSLFATQPTAWQLEETHCDSASSCPSDVASTSSSSQSVDGDGSNKSGVIDIGSYSSESSTQRRSINESVDIINKDAEEFDFSELIPEPSRKRALPQSPVHSTTQLNKEYVGNEDLKTPLLIGEHQLHSQVSLNSAANSETMEDAPVLVRSQSQWGKKPQSKRIRSSPTQEILMHTRQKTMESLWGAEDDDSDN